MRQIFTLLVGATLVIMSSCSSTQKVSQTPDDVYYSPASPKTTHTASSNGDQDEYYSTAPNDRYVRMKTVDQSRWSYFDDYNNYDSYYSPMSIGGGGYYGYPAYGYGYGYSPLSIGVGLDPYFGWNSYFMWNTCYNPYFYNPYYGAGVVVVNPKISATPVYSHLRTFNPSSYHSTAFSNGNSNRFYRPGGTTNTSSPNNSGSNYRYNNNNNTYNRPTNTGGSTRTFSSQPARSFSAPSGGGGSGGGGGGGFRPVRH